MTKNTGGQAFPSFKKIIHTGVHGNNEIKGFINGMTLRDYFAGQILSNRLSPKLFGSTDEELAKACYDLADAMIKERDKG